MTTPALKREPKGTSTGGQFAVSANPESTLVLDDRDEREGHDLTGLAIDGVVVASYRHVDIEEESAVELPAESSAKSLKGKEVYFALVYDEVTKTWREDSEYLRDGQQIYDAAIDNGSWEPIGAHDDLFQEARNSLQAKLLGVAAKSSDFDKEIAEHEAAIAETQKEYEDTYEDADYDDLMDLKKGIIEHHEDIARLQRMKIDALQSQVEKLQANESSFDLESAVTERVVLDGSSDRDVSPEQRDKIDALVRTYFFEGPTNRFDEGLGGLLDYEAEHFVETHSAVLEEILTETP